MLSSWRIFLSANPVLMYALSHFSQRCKTMKNATPRTIYLSDYTQPAYWIDTVDLTFELGEEQTRVLSRLTLRKNTAVEAAGLVLDGEQLTLGSLVMDGTVLTEEDYELDASSLTLKRLPADKPVITLEVETFIRPQENFSLEGLYKSSGNFCTQCEAEGFRKITYYLDRPDVMAVFSTRIIADRQKYPVLLSNGNPVDAGVMDDGRHWALWHDPHKKPCYLFALVAGDLAHIEDAFTTMSQRQVRLRIYVEKHNIEQCGHAMKSLLKAMKWDEERYGREYDLDVYNIVAVDDFNMGAMENKGLNIFNSKYVLARQETATDTDFINIEGVIGHEYFHNWSGNRVTCRDWFQLTLKEGLTVFRDQQFTADMNAAAPKRIDDVNVLRTAQFAEDGGPMAHPIQPDSYQEINNFYTVTVYNKGAEVIRMIHTLLGEEAFRRGMDRYFEQHDGCAVTTEDFLQAMEAAAGVDLTQFRRWYHQAGTPTLKVEERHDPERRRYHLTLSQTTAPTPGQESKQPFHIPVVTRLMNGRGESMPLSLCGDDAPAVDSLTLELREAQQTFVFEEVAEKPVLSLLRGYSAPVRLDFERSDEELAFCMAHESDEFNRWDAGQQLACRILLEMARSHRDGAPLSVADCFVDAFQRMMSDPALNKALLARALAIPSFQYVAEMMDVIDVEAVFVARETLQRTLAERLQPLWAGLYADNASQGFRLDPEAMGKRFLKNLALSYLMYLPGAGETHAHEQYNAADNMTDQLAAFRALVHHGASRAQEVTGAFYAQWRHDNLVMDKWFAIQASAPLDGMEPRLEKLLQHDDFDIKNPNRVRSVLGMFSAANPRCFHHASGYGYTLLGRYIEKLDAINPQVAARLCSSLTRWKRYDENRQVLMRAELERLLALPDLSRDVTELVTKSLG